MAKSAESSTTTWMREAGFQRSSCVIPGSDSLSDAGNDARLVALALGEMHREIRGFQRAPAQGRIDERELGPLRENPRGPGEQREGEPSFQSLIPPLARGILNSAFLRGGFHDTCQPQPATPSCRRRRGHRSRPVVGARAGLSVEEHARRHSDRPGRRRRPPRAHLRRFLGAAAQDQLRVRLLRRRGRAGGLRALHQQARARRPQPALRQHGAGDDHVRAAEAAVPLPRGLPVFLPPRRRRQHRLRAQRKPDQAPRGPGRRGEEARGQRCGEPSAAPGIDRHARPGQRAEGEVQPRALRRRQPDDRSR